MPTPAAPLPVSHPRTNLAAAGIALVLAGCAVAAGIAYSRHLQERYIHALAPEFTAPKLQGAALQKEAFAQPDLLVLYGSSELVRDVPNNASQFFQEYPTGFRVFPVGKPGTTSLAVLQKAAAVGRSMRGRKVAFSISPGWFFTESFDPKYYEGNFSELQATEFAFSSSLSRELKRDAARRMLTYPKTLDDRPVLEFALDQLAGDRPWNRALYAAAWPLGKLHCAVARMQDHAETAVHILEEDERLGAPAKRAARAMNWGDVLKRAARFVNAAAVQTKRNEVKRRNIPRASRDTTFLRTIAAAQEWTDVELLMRTFQELGAQPLLLTMPVEDVRLEVYGVSPAARDAYVQRLGALAQEYRFPIADFREHTKNAGFMVDFLDHLSGEGWLYYNKALDDFFHNRLPAL